MSVGVTTDQKQTNNLRSKIINCSWSDFIVIPDDQTTCPHLISGIHPE